MNLLIYKVALAGIALTTSMAKKDEDVKFELKGFTSSVETFMERPAQTLVTDAEQWAKVWEGHKGPPFLNGITNADGQVPKVDFEKSNVIAIFAGQMRSVQGFDVADVVDTEKLVTIKLVPISMPGGESVLANPFALIEVSKVKRPIEVKIATGNNQWKTIGTFTPPKESAAKSQSGSR